MRLRGKTGGSVQRGFALIALLALAALISAFLIASALDLTSAGNSNAREDRSMSALRKAKAALIAYAANEQWQAYKGQVSTQPGGLPCPDIDPDTTPANTGVSAGALCTTSGDYRVGRFPFATIGADDLRDASGERLWYAVSSNFYKNSALAINSETQGLLTVTGTAPANNVVAIVFAPGPPIRDSTIPTQIQDRTGSGYNRIASYLENFTQGTDYTFSSNAFPSDTFNDRLLVITQAELMAVVEPAVAARIERDIGKGLLQDYLAKWGRYPFAVPFALPPVVPQGSYLGTASTMRGSLPVTNTATFTWQNPTVIQIPGGMGSPVLDSATCSISSLTVTCNVQYRDSRGGGYDWECRPNIQIQMLLTNAHLAFADAQAPLPGDTSNFRMRDGNNNVPNDQPSPYGYWSAVGSVVPTQSFLATATGGLLTYTGRLQNAEDMNREARITITLPAPGYLPRLANPSGTNPNIAWFLSNQWYRQTYYAMSAGLAPGSGAGACNPPTVTAPSCLTVNNLPGSTNNKEAILVLAGRALDGQTRSPSPTLSDYFEGQNATPADLIFEHRAGVATSINDRVVVVSP